MIITSFQNLPNSIDASQITSGTLPDARIASAGTWNAKQAALVSGSNIKTVNGNSLLGSGNISIGGLPSVSSADNGKVLAVVNGVWAKTDNIPIEFFPVGGRIFYNTGSGNTYKFYTQYKIEITDTTIAGLASAYYYRVTAGTSTTHRYYVYDNTNELQSGKQWGKRGTSIGITGDGIGMGKTNTAKALTYSGWEDNSIFTYIQTCRDNNLGGCNDWFIASQAEQDQLRLSGVVNWYSSNHIWSSVEVDINGSDYWNYSGKSWYLDYKSRECYAFAARSF